MPSFSYNLQVTGNAVRKDTYGPPGPGTNIFSVNFIGQRTFTLGYDDNQATDSVSFGGSLVNGETLIIDLMNLPTPWGFGFASIKSILIQNTSTQITSYFTVGSTSPDQLKTFNAVTGMFEDYQRTLYGGGVEVHHSQLMGDGVTSTSRYLTLTGYAATNSSSSAGGPIESLNVEYQIAVIGVVLGAASS